MNVVTDIDPTVLPAAPGLPFKNAHWPEIAAMGGGAAWFEVHAENYMGAGGPPHRMLGALRALRPLSLHGVGLSIGGEGRLDREHLCRLRALVDRYQPASFSEHLAWSTHEGVYFNDLLPLPYNPATLARVADHVDETQEALGRRLLLENPSAYLALEGATMAETDFLAELARRTGCGCCSTSTMSGSRRSTGASTRSSISTPFRCISSAKSISRAMRRRPTARGAAC